MASAAVASVSCLLLGSAVSVKMASAALGWLSCFLLVVTLRSGTAEISDVCVQCLCEAVSGGPNCVLGGSCYDGVCGPYAITFPYWQDGGRPTVGIADDRQSVKTYEKCALDATCAEATIRGYMTKFRQDCNGDGLVNCWDYAALHFNGGYGCKKPLNVPAKNALSNCLQRQEADTTVGPPPTSVVPVQPSTPEGDPDDNHVDIVFPKPASTSPPFDFKLDTH